MSLEGVKGSHPFNHELEPLRLTRYRILTVDACFTLRHSCFLREYRCSVTRGLRIGALGMVFLDTGMALILCCPISSGEQMSRRSSQELDADEVSSCCYLPL